MVKCDQVSAKQHGKVRLLGCFEQSLAAQLTFSILKMRLGVADVSSVGTVHLNAHFKRVKL